MKLFRSSLSVLVGVLAAVVISVAPASAVTAGSATLAVSPAAGTYAAGSTFSVTISEDSGTNEVDSARAQLTYNAATLEVVGFSTSANPFTTCVTAASAAGGSITTGDCTLLGGKKQGKQTLGVVTFKVLASNGSSSVAFSAASQVVNNGTDLALSMVDGVYSYTAPAPAPVQNNPTPAANNKPAARNTTSTPATVDPAPTAETKPEVKSEETKTDAPKQDTVINTAEEKGSMLPYILVFVAAAAAALLGRRVALMRLSKKAAAAKQPAKKPVAAKKKPARRK